MRKAVIFLIFTSFIFGAAADTSQASVSNAAVLFLRIAAGARAAGMGEAFVAVADDATATHWNPAGLGMYPLSNKWVDITVPKQYRPLKKVALFKSGGDLEYDNYDIWGLSPVGLLKYSKGKWSNGDVIDCEPRETADIILRRYTGLAGESAEDKIPAYMEILGRANNPSPISRIDSLESQIMPLVTSDDKMNADLDSLFGVLKAAYNECMIDWSAFDNAADEFENIVKKVGKNKADDFDESVDSVGTMDAYLESRKEISSAIAGNLDKIYFSLKKAKRKYMPEEIMIPYSINFEGEPIDIDAGKKFIWIATESKLFRYDGRSWRGFGTDEGLPPGKIHNLKAYGKRVYISTDSGLVIYDAGAFVSYEEMSGLPRKPIDAVTEVNDKNIWVIVDDDLYHYDGISWKNYLEYTDVLNEEIAEVYNRLEIYGTPREREAYIAKYDALNAKSEEETNVVPESGAPLSKDEMLQMIDSVGVMDAFKTINEVIESKADSIAADTVPEVAIPQVKMKTLGQIIKVPYCASIPFDVYDIEMDDNNFLWVGTKYGLLRFNGHDWTRYGYRRYIIENDITVFDLAMSKVRGDTLRAEKLADMLMSVNDLESDQLTSGQEIRMYANPGGSGINDIKTIGKKVYFATESGTISYADGHWSRFSEQGLGRRNTRTIEEHGGNLWFATVRRIKIKAAAKSEIAMMHVNWLPELASDIYYEFFSYVQNVEEWGTVGGNITFLSYGQIARTGQQGEDLGDFSAFDIALTLSYGTSLSNNLSGGLSAKIIYSHLSDIGTAAEKGSGTSTGMALDIGLMYKFHPRWSLGVAVTNLGPDVSYIDVAQADPLPRNLAVGLATYLIKSQYNNFLVTAEMNKSLVGLDGSLSEEFREIIYNVGGEYRYGSFIAFRGGYIYDEEGDVKTPTLGFGLTYRVFKFDFAYIPSSDDVPLANTMRLALSVNF